MISLQIWFIFSLCIRDETVSCGVIISVMFTLEEVSLITLILICYQGHDPEQPPTSFSHRSLFIKKLLRRKVWKMMSLFTIYRTKFSALKYILWLDVKRISFHLPQDMSNFPCEMSFTQTLLLSRGAWFSTRSNRLRGDRIKIALRRSRRASCALPEAGEKVE